MHLKRKAGKGKISLDIIWDFRWQKERALRVFLCTCSAEGAIVLSPWLSGDVLYYTSPGTVLYFTGYYIVLYFTTPGTVLYCTVLHRVLYFTVLFFTGYCTVLYCSSPGTVLYCTEYSADFRCCTPLGTVLHCTALGCVLRQVVKCTNYRTAPGTLLHWVR